MSSKSICVLAASVTVLLGVWAQSTLCDSPPASSQTGQAAASSKPATQPGSAPSSQAVKTFTVPWEHQPTTRLADLFLSRAGQDLEKAYTRIPPEHLARLQREYDGHRGPGEKPFADLSKAHIVALYMAVQPMWRAETWKQEDEPWQECVFYELPDGTKISLRFQLAHPFLAEYHRKAVIAPSGEKLIELPLPMNTGGRTAINVYLYPQEGQTGPFIRLQDAFGESLLDLQRRAVLLVMRVGDAAYAGEMTTENASSGWSTVNGGSLSVRGGGKPADLLQGRLAGPGEYLGRIDGTKGQTVFIPVSVEKEQEIPFNYERMPRPPVSPGSAK